MRALRLVAHDWPKVRGIKRMDEERGVGKVDAWNRSVGGGIGSLRGLGQIVESK